MTTVARSGFMTKAAIVVGLALLPAVLGTGFARSANTNTAVAALVMELSGVTKPPLAVHREVAPGTKIAIAPGARLCFFTTRRVPSLRSLAARSR